MLMYILLVFLLLFIVWRIASNYISIPCPTWIAWMVEMENPFVKSNRSSFIVNHLGLQSGMKVLDMGCGPGRVTIPLAQALSVGQVVAMDIQEGMLQRVKQKANKLGLRNIKYIHAGIGQGLLQANTFDRIVMVAVLGEVPDQKAALQELFHTLKPGGILSVSELIFDPHFQRQGSVGALAQEMGFVVKEIFGGWHAYTMHLQKPE